MRGSLSDDYIACLQSRSLWGKRHQCVQNDALFGSSAAAVHLAECVVPTD